MTQQTSKIPIKLQKPSQTQSSLKLLPKLINLTLFFAFLVLISIPVIYLLGSKRIHTHDLNILYDVFDNSTHHQQLSKSLSKSKYAIIHGHKQNALFHFINHFANQQTLKQRKVIVQHFHQPMSFVNEYLEEIKYHLQQILDLEDKFKSIWILTSQTGQNIPKSPILKIIHRHPKDKIIIVTTGTQKIPSFQTFEYPLISEHDVKQSIEKNFELDEKTADILYDFYGTPQSVMDSLDMGRYSQEQLLGENYRQLVEFSQQDMRVLKDLCKKGEVKAENISENLGSFGVISYQGNAYWLNRYLMLNYQLHKKTKCGQQGVASEQILFEIERRKSQGLIEKSEEQLLEEQVWNEDEIVKLQQSSKKKKSKKGKKNKN